jgi:hypothetical protein
VRSRPALADDAETEVSAAAGTGGRPDLQESITNARPVDEILFEKLSAFVSGVPSPMNAAGRAASWACRPPSPGSRTAMR